MEMVPRVDVCYYLHVSSAQGGVIGAEFHLPCQDILRVACANQPPETDRNLYARMVQKESACINSGLMSEVWLLTRYGAVLLRPKKFGSARLSVWWGRVKFFVVMITFSD